MAEQIVDEFLQAIRVRGSLQDKYLEHFELRDSERKEFNDFLMFYRDELGKTMQEMVEGYLFLNKMFQEETYYFLWKGTYRYNKFSEVEDNVYRNTEYMQKYMIGLSISEYLWYQHLSMIRHFEEILTTCGGKYLEIGPGGGQYLIKAVKSGRFDSIEACDISETSVKLTSGFIRYLGLDKQCSIIKKDFFDYKRSQKFNLIVMGEVLEHVENPIGMLVKIRELLCEDGTAYVTTVINGPAIDHIYLFRSVEEVFEVVKQAGFVVKDHICVTAGGISLEKAKKKKMVIDIAMILKTKED